MASLYLQGSMCYRLIAMRNADVYVYCKDDYNTIQYIRGARPISIWKLNTILMTSCI